MTYKSFRYQTLVYVSCMEETSYFVLADTYFLWKSKYQERSQSNKHMKNSQNTAHIIIHEKQH